MDSEKPRMKVLVCEDTPDHFELLEERFGMYNENPSGEFIFELTHAATVHEVSDNLRGHRQWDVMVIDRKFQEHDPDDSQYWNKHILRAANDLGCRAVKIIYTAHYGQDDRSRDQDLIECMRMGAWDYIHKNLPRKTHGSSYQDVVDSAVEGLRDKRLQTERLSLGSQAAVWIQKHERELLKSFPGEFVPLERVSQGQWQVLADCAKPTLFEVYWCLRDKADLNAIHILWVDEHGGTQ